MNTQTNTNDLSTTINYTWTTKYGNVVFESRPLASAKMRLAYLTQLDTEGLPADKSFNEQQEAQAIREAVEAFEHFQTVK